MNFSAQNRKSPKKWNSKELKSPNWLKSWDRTKLPQNNNWPIGEPTSKKHSSRKMTNLSKSPSRGKNNQKQFSQMSWSGLSNKNSLIKCNRYSNYKLSWLMAANPSLKNYPKSTVASLALNSHEMWCQSWCANSTWWLHIRVTSKSHASIRWFALNCQTT